MSYSENKGFAYVFGGKYTLVASVVPLVDDTSVRKHREIAALYFDKEASAVKPCGWCALRPFWAWFVPMTYAVQRLRWKVFPFCALLYISMFCEFMPLYIGCLSFLGLAQPYQMGQLTDWSSPLGQTATLIVFYLYTDPRQLSLYRGLPTWAVFWLRVFFHLVSIVLIAATSKVRVTAVPQKWQFARRFGVMLCLFVFLPFVFQFLGYVFVAISTGCSINKVWRSCPTCTCDQEFAMLLLPRTGIQCFEPTVKCQ